ncbi:bifunctional indole-3-glycerol-phosphate synthase TrpC/phosphoribosylanthranilate isomerase TrpF [Corynebacterium choanae]|uniref:N-(5'-phosphoribosyl)anthranilate isomerase n=1 Tax=Corynebacterium choanae TaxID=1862358 RepID=A0A3G6JA72_9CORY|nr:bifunctional indole-3-glycerol-phosphate synthase TrpC/phosphoribosylanthranilate isomerase TrpF [Corynebacterium choanae]AZA14712.1 Tryptophan biosynthesis protein TrpCF [Corynebacterium choanae]
MSGSMPTVLENIVAARRGHLAGIADQLQGVDLQALPRSTRSLYDSLRQSDQHSFLSSEGTATGAPQDASTQSDRLPRGNMQFIMECKSASPSLGMIREHYQPGDIARIYSRYAAGISVLCEPERFGGSYDHLATVAASTHLPVLCKDFIIDEIQVYAARYFGADAILLMLSVLDDDTYRRLADLAATLGLDVLTEVVDEAEVARATALGAKIFGINHRNLHDLSIDLGRSARLAPLCPPDAVVVAESGIRNHDHVQQLAAPVNGFLVGSQLTGEPDVDHACRALVFGEHKVCGLTSGSMAQAARAAGAVYGGLIVEPASPRAVSRDQATAIMGAEPNLHYVAVTRQPSGWADVLPAGVHAIQIHSPLGTPAEERELVQAARKELARCTASQNASQSGEATNNPDTTIAVWRALPMNDPAAAAIATMLVEESLVDMLVLDSGQGGTGTAFDWNTIPDSVKSHSLLAGGIGLENLREALAIGCRGVDLNSGMEYGAAAGEHRYAKDPGKLLRAFSVIRRFHPSAQ